VVVLSSAALNRYPMRALIIFFATGVYSGYSPFAPGTAGSAVGIVVLLALFAPLWNHSPALALGAFALVFAAGCWVAGRAEVIFGEHDSPKIVLDEVLGMVATMFGNPLGPVWLAAGFVLFRVADIIKPWPASFFDRSIGGGAGVMLDDLAAAVYANIALQILWRVL
jgi:phosphatidylglycerophosphatase A